MKRIKIFTDGGSRGNPGPSAVGILVLESDGKELLRLGKQIGSATSNIAEYTAVFEALLWVRKNLAGVDLDIEFFLDSSLVVNQLNGKFKIKNQDLKKIVVRIKNLEKEISSKIRYIHIAREKNKTADFLVNSAF